jgi:hypothetical protein
VRFKSSIISQASGSLGGSTYSHNAGGMYIRNRSTPTNPNTTYQQAVRSLVAQLVNLWQGTLTATQRAEWAAYAANVPLNDVFGDPRYRSGINHYVRSNTPLLQAGGTRVDDGPTTYNLGDFTAPTIGIDATADEIDVTFATGDDWVSETGAYMLVYCSAPQNATVNFFKGPYRYAGKISGDSGSPPASPASIALPFPCVAGQKIFAKIAVVRADGRLSSPFRSGAIGA